MGIFTTLLCRALVIGYSLLPHLSLSHMLQQLTYTDSKPFKAYWEVPVWVYSLLYYAELWSLPASLSHMLQQITYTDSILRNLLKHTGRFPRFWVYSLLYYAELWSLSTSLSHMLQQITYTDRKPFKAYWEVPVWVFTTLLCRALVIVHIF